MLSSLIALISHKTNNSQHQMMLKLGLSQFHVFNETMLSFDRDWIIRERIIKEWEWMIYSQNTLGRVRFYMVSFRNSPHRVVCTWPKVSASPGTCDGTRLLKSSEQSLSLSLFTLSEWCLMNRDACPVAPILD